MRPATKMATATTPASTLATSSSRGVPTRSASTSGKRALALRVVAHEARQREQHVDAQAEQGGQDDHRPRWAAWSCRRRSSRRTPGTPGEREADHPRDERQHARVEEAVADQGDGQRERGRRARRGRRGRWPAVRRAAPRTSARTRRCRGRAGRRRAPCRGPCRRSRRAVGEVVAPAEDRLAHQHGQGHQRHLAQGSPGGRGGGGQDAAVTRAWRGWAARTRRTPGSTCAARPGGWSPWWSTWPQYGPAGRARHHMSPSICQARMCASDLHKRVESALRTRVRMVT